MDLAYKARQERFRFAAFAVGWAVVVIAAIVAYWPGLSGPFMLDDFGSIAALGDYGGVRNWETFKAFVLGGHAGPTGRPLALVTFLLDARNWPADPWPFKRTNLVIHILNGALLGILTSQILGVLNMTKRRARGIALVATACWLLHPFLVSTTLYVVQRMTQLATLFVFAGLVGFMYGRSRIATHGLRAYAIMSASLAFCTLLAMIAKENGVLLPLLAGVLELTVLASQRSRVQALNRTWAGLFLVAPSVLIFLYLAQYTARHDFFVIVPPRDYSLFERILTEPRILVDYLDHWFIPKLYTTGVFQDHFTKSTGLFAPVSTALSLLLHAALLTLAVIKRRQWPLLSLAILFFYGGHLVESTVVNLELYFEHRNYLAGAFLFLPLVAALREKLRPKMFFIVSAGVLLLLGGFTRYSATVWQDMSSMVAASAHKAPTSVRAQGQYATDLYNAGRVDEALRVLDRAIAATSSNHPLLYVTRLNILCRNGTLTHSEFNDVSEELGSAYYDPRSIRLYTVLVESVTQNKCPAVTPGDLQAMFTHMLDVPDNDHPRQLGYSHIKYFIGYTRVFMGDPAGAVAAFEESLASRPGASHAMVMAALLASNDYYEEALHISDIALTQVAADRHSAIGGHRVSEADIRNFQAIVRADIDARQGGDISDPGD